MPELFRKRTLERLTARREPHWERISKGGYLGYRAPAATWHARYRDRQGKQHWKPLDTAQNYDTALQAAKEWIATFTGAPVRTIKRADVRTALEAYTADLRRHGRHGAAKEAESRFKSTGLYPRKARGKRPAGKLDALASLPLEDVTNEDILAWRDRQTNNREPRTVNRHVRAVVAGLNRAVAKLGYVGNPMAWKLNQLVDEREDEGTAEFLTAKQRANLIAAATPAAALFFNGLQLTAARPHELAAAKVSDFDGESLRLAHRKGRPPKLRTRLVVLSRPAVSFFAAQAANKSPTAKLFTPDGIHPWRKHTWAREMRAAIAASEAITPNEAERAPLGTGCYAFRHSRISELLQLHDIDPVTVARQVGTSVTMIEKTYFRFIRAAMAEKLANVKEPT